MWTTILIEIKTTIKSRKDIPKYVTVFRTSPGLLSWLSSSQKCGPRYAATFRKNNGRSGDATIWSSEKAKSWISVNYCVYFVGSRYIYIYTHLSWLVDSREKEICKAGRPSFSLLFSYSNYTLMLLGTYRISSKKERKRKGWRTMGIRAGIHKDPKEPTIGRAVLGQEKGWEFRFRYENCHKFPCASQEWNPKYWAHRIPTRKGSKKRAAQKGTKFVHMRLRFKVQVKQQYWKWQRCLAAEVSEKRRIWATGLLFPSSKY